MATVRITANIEGLQELQAQLDRAVEALEAPSLTESMGAGADILVDAAKAGLHSLSGELASTIMKIPIGDTGWSIGPKGSVVYANIQDGGGTNFGNPYMILPDGAYVHEVHIPGQHYMDAARAQSSEAVRVVVAEVEYKIGF